MQLKNGQYLSAREFQCVELLLQGFTAKEIAKRLFLSPRTVETHPETYVSTRPRA